MARLVPISAPSSRKVLGLLEGQIHVPDDFDAPLPDDVLDAFEGR
jgi:antitoxin (DNA-binding transcriptional repressor) of toxin-antitoxin stability system